MPAFKTEIIQGTEHAAAMAVSVDSSVTAVLATVTAAAVSNMPWADFVVDTVASVSPGTAYPVLSFWLCPKTSNGDFEVTGSGGGSATLRPSRSPDFVVMLSSSLSQRVVVPWQHLPAGEFQLRCHNGTIAVVTVSVRLRPVTEVQMPWQP